MPKAFLEILMGASYTTAEGGESGRARMSARRWASDYSNAEWWSEVAAPGDRRTPVGTSQQRAILTTWRGKSLTVAGGLRYWYYSGLSGKNHLRTVWP